MEHYNCHKLWEYIRETFSLCRLVFKIDIAINAGSVVLALLHLKLALLPHLVNRNPAASYPKRELYTHDSIVFPN